MSTISYKPGILKRICYWVLHVAARVIAILFYELRVYGRERLPAGPALILCTHQSNLDPVLVGLTFNERISSVARLTLFSNPALGSFLRFLDAIELDRDRSGLAGLKEMLQRLKARQKVLIFPEGTRSRDGAISSLRPGFLAVARRTQVPLIPIAITGAFEALPPGSLWPRRYPLRLAIGELIEYSEYGILTDAEAMELISHQLHSCYARADSLREHSIDRYCA